ncbi:MAG TPA: peptidylprolyl isomerase [Acetobacteraceae bacterium]|jgi:peptidylprolyl isomerase|nr:peptidylprolyl isomerase [Acetobacteraceae bacterium]
MNRRRLIAHVATLPVLLAAGRAAAQPKLDPENTLYLDLKSGRVVIQMFPDLAPKTVAQIKTLARQHFYDGTPFHRVIEGFMAQGGDPTGTGMGGSKLPDVPAEFTNLRHFLRGTCGMARAGDPNSGNSQFFIMFAPAPGLDGKYTIWGQVVQGMQFVDMIKRGTGPNGEVEGTPDQIVHMQVATDVK